MAHEDAQHVRVLRRERPPEARDDLLQERVHAEARGERAAGVAAVAGRVVAVRGVEDAVRGVAGEAAVAGDAERPRELAGPRVGRVRDLRGPEISGQRRQRGRDGRGVGRGRRPGRALGPGRGRAPGAGQAPPVLALDAEHGLRRGVGPRRHVRGGGVVEERGQQARGRRARARVVRRPRRRRPRGVRGAVGAPEERAEPQVLVVAARDELALGAAVPAARRRPEALRARPARRDGRDAGGERAVEDVRAPRPRRVVDRGPRAVADDDRRRDEALAALVAGVDGRRAVGGDAVRVVEGRRRRRRLPAQGVADVGAGDDEEEGHE